MELSYSLILALVSECANVFIFLSSVFLIITCGLLELLMSDTQRNEAISDVNQLPHPGTLFMSLDLLAVLPAAVEDLDLSRPNKVQYDEQLIHFSALLFTCLEKLITARNHCFHNHEIISLLRLVRAWGSASGITLTRMADENHSLFVFILNCLNAAEDVQCMCEGALCVQELVTVNEYPRPGYRNSVVAMIMEAWAGLPPDDNEGVVDIGAFENSNLQYLLQSSGTQLLSLTFVTSTN